MFLASEARGVAYRGSIQSDQVPCVAMADQHPCGEWRSRAPQSQGRRAPRPERDGDVARGSSRVRALRCVRRASRGVCGDSAGSGRGDRTARIEGHGGASPRRRAELPPCRRGGATGIRRNATVKRCGAIWRMDSCRRTRRVRCTGLNRMEATEGYDAAGVGYAVQCAQGQPLATDVGLRRRTVQGTHSASCWSRFNTTC